MTARLNSWQRARPLLGTLVEISAAGDPRFLPAAMEAAFAGIERVHRLMSFHLPDSDVSRLNREAHRRIVEVDPQTREVLGHAQAISEASAGAFDVTVAPRLVDWGYLPRAAAPQTAVLPGGYQRIELRADGGVRFMEPVLIDLGGIAKGYAVDCACAALESHGVVDYIVNAGGDLRVGRTPEIVHVRHPRWPARAIPLATVTYAAVATSGAYFARRPWNDGSVHPIVAPATGTPGAVRDSVSVLGIDCMTADALTKVVSVLAHRAAPVLAHFGAEACCISMNGQHNYLPARQDRNVKPDHDRVHPAAH